ncbi:MAG: heme lyase CcmF/NrfE family subunit [Lautropia sp.]|nr:heme lyase CcmF/NrfE family subunit [Lautropia sp.]
MAVAAVQTALGLVGGHRGDARLMKVASNAANAQMLLIVLAFSCLAVSFIDNDFTIVNVANNSNSRLPAAYRLAATWGSHEGSMLLWALMLACWTAAVVNLGGGLDAVVRARVVGVLGLISAGFVAFLLFTSNPFLRSLPAPADGRDLNPLLQDPGMVIHPPMLYMGYVGFSVAFAFAIAAMLGGRVDAAWTRWARPWTTAAWCFLTMGIALGSAWAYYELGWGGWWFWDPVENASFMPWLVGTALMHSLIVTERRGSFKGWTLLLAISAFSLSLLGTFLVRSGVLTSVHAFATDPARGIFILVFLVLVVGGSLTLFAWRAPSLSGNITPVSFSASSREGFLLANNLLLTVAAAAVFLGTLYPLLLDTLGLGKISVGPPYFEAVFFPLLAPAVFLMGVGPMARWRSAPVPDVARRLRWAMLVAVATTVLIGITSGRFSLDRLDGAAGGALGAIGFAIGIFIATWVVAASLTLLLERLKEAGGGAAFSVIDRLRSLPAGFYGMLLAHIGVGVFTIGVACVNTLQVEVDQAVRPGESLRLKGYDFKLVGLRRVDGPNYQATRGQVEVLQNGATQFTLWPEKRVYSSQGSVMTEADIDSGLTRDVYVSLGELLPDGRWTIKAWIKPFIGWIWAGCFLMALGGFAAISDRRYRAANRTAAKAGVRAPAAANSAP